MNMERGVFHFLSKREASVPHLPLVGGSLWIIKADGDLKGACHYRAIDM